jgi:hypothetical protein
MSGSREGIINMTDSIEAGPREPSPHLPPNEPARHSYQPYQPAATAQPYQPAATAQPYQPAATAPPAATIPARKLLIAGVVVVLLIIVAIVGHVVASANTISAGDCVVTNPNVLTGWDIKKIGCNSNPGTGLMVQKVVSVQNGSNGQCDLGLTTFQDEPNGKTYCLDDLAFGNG